MPAAEGDGASSAPAVSGGGRFVAFASDASNLVFGDANGKTDVFVRDRVTGQTERVSVGAGGGAADGASVDPSISADGRYVAFSSDAPNLVAGDSNATSDVFVRDRLTASTERVSVSSGGEQAVGASSEPSISADGRFVAFTSVAPNLVLHDSNNAPDVFVRARLSLAPPQVGGDLLATDELVAALYSSARVLGTTRVSVESDGREANGGSSQPAISGDGQYVAFRSTASNLVAGDYNGVADVFVRALLTPAPVGSGRDPVAGVGVFGTTRVSVSSGGGEASGASFEPSISADGQLVAFTSVAQLAGGDTADSRDVWLRDRSSDSLTWVSQRAAAQGQPSDSPSISADGSYVAFVTAAGLMANDFNGVADVYEFEVGGGFVARLSVDDDLAESNAASGAPALSGDGTYAGFSSQASNLGADANATADVFVHTWKPSTGLPAPQAAGTTQGAASAGAGSELVASCGGGGVDPAPDASRSAQTAADPVLAAVVSKRVGQRCDLDVASLGLERPLGDCGGGELATNQTVCRSDPINTATGSHVTEVTDLALPGIGLGFEFARTYNSGDPTVGALGGGWTHSYASSLSIRAGGLVVVARGATGQRLVFTRQLDGSYLAAPGGRARLVARVDGFELVRTDQLRYRFDSSGRLSELLERNGQRLAFGYQSGQLATITDTTGRQIALSYTGGLLSQVALPDGRKVSYGYSSGLLSSVTDVRGGVTRYEYTGGRLSKIIDQNNHAVIETIYGPGGRANAQIDVFGKRTSFSWDEKTQTSTMTDTRGHAWRDVYSSDYQLLSEADPLGNTSTYSYDRDSNVIAVKDPRGHSSEMSYDARGNLLTRTDPLGQTETFTYNDRNDPVTATNARGFSTRYDYDSVGNVIRVTDPAGAETTFGLDPAGTGLLKRVTDPRGKTQTFAHDSQGNVTATTTPKGFQRLLATSGG